MSVTTLRPMTYRTLTVAADTLIVYLSEARSDCSRLWAGLDPSLYHSYRDYHSSCNKHDPTTEKNPNTANTSTISKDKACFESNKVGTQRLLHSEHRSKDSDLNSTALISSTNRDCLLCKEPTNSYSQILTLSFIDKCRIIEETTTTTWSNCTCATTSVHYLPQSCSNYRYPTTGNPTASQINQSAPARCACVSTRMMSRC